MRRTEKYTLFYSKADCFSNWHPSRFDYHGIAFVCMEQFMMYAKARLFKDDTTAAKILATADPGEHKRLGRAVQNYVDAVWEEKCESIVAVGAREKFAQNPGMLQVLLSTRGTELVEAAAHDRKWGIGLGIDDPRALDPSQWRGQNKLGKTLEKVREHFLRLEAQPPVSGPTESKPVSPPVRVAGAAFIPRKKT